MSRGSKAHDAVSQHLAECAQCRAADPDSKRARHADLSQISERDVPAETLAAMCPDGRWIYWAYLRWLAEPDW